MKNSSASVSRCWDKERGASPLFPYFSPCMMASISVSKYRFRPPNGTDFIYPTRSQFHSVDESTPSLCSASLRVKVRGLSSFVACDGLADCAISLNSCRRSSSFTVTLMPVAVLNNSSRDIAFIYRVGDPIRECLPCRLSRRDTVSCRLFRPLLICIVSAPKGPGARKLSSLFSSFFCMFYLL